MPAHSLIKGFSNLQQFRYGGDKGFPVSEEPTYLAFCVDFNFNSTYLETFGVNSSPLFDESKNTDQSAVNYLMSRGMNAEAMRLAEFNRLLKEVSLNKPWYFQSVKGIGKMWGNATNVAEAYKGKELTLEFDTLESLDLKVSYLADLYRKSIYDTIYMRENVPDNLRSFNMTIYVGEFRHLEIFTGVGPGAAPGTIIEVNAGYFADNATFYAFDCYMCEFDFSGSTPSDEFGVSGFEQPAANSFKVNVGWFMEKHQFSFYDVVTEERWTSGAQEWRLSRKEVLDGITGALIPVNDQLSTARGIRVTT
jgi:hypothetical protein